MIRERAYPVEPWHVRETRLDIDVLAQSESVFALSNGHIGLRGNLDEGEPHGLPGTYLNSFYELRPLPYAEAGFGFPESGQTIVNVTNGKLIRLLVDDEPLDVRYGEVLAHERVLDLRAGTLHRSLHWRSPAGREVRVHTTRLVSFRQRSVAAIRYQVEVADDKPLRLIIQSELVANETLPPQSRDPRVAAVLESPLEAEEELTTPDGGLLIHRTKVSGLRVAAAMEHEVGSPARTRIESEGYEDWVRTTIGCVLEPGQQLCVTKYLTYGWSSRRSLPALRDQVGAALAAARLDGWDGLVREQREYLDEFWDAADVEVEGDPEVQQAVRFGLFHVLQAGARAERRPISAKGLTGPGYDGHAFWDTEMFVLPVLTYTHPAAVRDALYWRHSTLEQAHDRARTLNLGGAAFPWRTIEGPESSGYWPAGTAAFHIAAGIADAVRRYVLVTGDRQLERDIGLTLLVETARLWRSLGHHDRDGEFHIDGVTGPDEYTAVKNDNIYTNLMAQRNLIAAADAAVRYRDEAFHLGVTDEETAAWRDAAAAMHIPYDDELDVHQQVEGFTRLQEWDFADTPQDKYPLLLHYPYFDLYRKQVIKQADLVLAMHWRGDAFTAEEKLRNFLYYERRTVRDSSLSACTQAVLAAEVGYPELAHSYLREAALMDLHDLNENTRDGVHMAALAGAWIALVAGFGGLRDHDGVPSFEPHLSSRLNHLAFALQWCGMRLRVDVRPHETTYSLHHGEPDAVLELRHYGKPVRVTGAEAVTVPNPKPRPDLPPVEQAPGRAPLLRLPENPA
ncbi:glycoside hydrolase family 65 protein [Micromonospora endophytica]|uniref:Family 65 glycosyl hydrolase n=1 Tax=Micromonospora endophytica TaxID=515350 RepID=A0A2W2CWB1_9ACTN|nr:glycosyl hydrolase family 65 protein [Micromonospora endophytica]PZF92237.1 family 65 glycosyl hydrolase [Micromonospora endophytica]RIW45652.1 glycoside hydrolase family 65 protein [Micromonospora endophytica]BCJ58868.1 glycosyl hydrolase [Micromonospora endophytica]